MGKQVNFYLMCDDLNALEFDIRKHTPDLIILPAYSSVPKPEMLASFREARNSFYGRCYLTRPEFSSSIGYEFYPQRGESGEYCFADARLSAIEFDIPRLIAGELTRGRLYTPSDYLSADRRELLRPPPEFSQWVDRVMGTARRLFPIDRERAWGNRLGPSARAALEHGDITLRMT